MAGSIKLTNSQWARIQPLLPPKRRFGRPRADDRRTLTAILWVLRTGARWVDLPPHLGDDSTAHRRLKRWSADGTWDRIWHTLLADLDAAGKLDWERCALDGSYVCSKGGAMSSARAAAA